MKSNIRFFICLSIIIYSCNNSIEKQGGQNSFNEKNNPIIIEQDENVDKKYPNGRYCADVKYSNPNTGTQSSYKLIIELEDNEIIKINFPSGGWMDNDHFKNATIDNNGYSSFISDKGYTYKIQIIGKEEVCISNSKSKNSQCKGTTKTGARCKNKTDNSNGLCWRHQKK